MRLTQEEVEVHPDWIGSATRLPGIRLCGAGWPRLSAAMTAATTGSCSSPTSRAAANFIVDDEDRIRELAAFGGAALDALGLARRAGTKSL